MMALEFVHVPDGVPAVRVQLMPPLPDTVPVPVPDPVTVTVVGLKVAITDCAEFMVTEHAPVPLQLPLQPAKADPADEVGLSATVVP